MGELGARLREAREGRGYSLEQAEEATRIRRVFLQALEEERFQDLPGDVYIRGFVRNYGRFLGLDPEELLAAYRKAAGISHAGIPRVLDEPLLHRTPTNLWSTVFLVVMVLAVVSLIAWYAYNRFYLGVEPWPVRKGATPSASSAVVQTTPTLVIVRAIMTATLAPSAEPTTRPTTSGPTATKRAGLSPTPSERSTDVRLTATATIAQPTQVTATSQPTGVQATKAAPPTPAPQATAVSPTLAPTSITPASPGAIRVQTNVLTETYLEVTIDGRKVFTGILRQGADRTWDAASAMRIRIGNAAGLKLMVNGVEVGPFGEKGKVVDVEYTPDTLPKAQ